MTVIKTAYSVIISGSDKSSLIADYCTDISISKTAGSATDTSTLTFADADGRVFMPQKRSPIEIYINGVNGFVGFVDDVDYEFGEGGKALNISASSVDSGGKIKEPDLRHKDDATFADVAKEWGASKGFEVFISGSITDIEREYWIMQNESFQSWAEFIAQEIGATFKAIGNKAFFVGRNEGLSASGKSLTPISAIYGQNLLSGSVSPIVTRPKYAKTAARYFDQALGEYVTEKIDTGIQGVEAVWQQALSTASKDSAKQLNNSNSKTVEREQGDGQVVILGDAAAEPEAKVTLSGLRQGVDGSYRADSVQHQLSENGFLTTIGLKHPTDGAGVDSR